jgi:hypothetical protein
MHCLRHSLTALTSDNEWQQSDPIFFCILENPAAPSTKIVHHDTFLFSGHEKVIADHPSARVLLTLAIDIFTVKPEKGRSACLRPMHVEHPRVGPLHMDARFSARSPTTFPFGMGSDAEAHNGSSVQMAAPKDGLGRRNRLDAKP